MANNNSSSIEPAGVRHVEAGTSMEGDTGNEEESSLPEEEEESDSSDDEPRFITPGYDEFKKDLGCRLPPDVIMQLASLLGYQCDVTDDLHYDEEDVGHVMVTKMEEAGDIRPRSIWDLTRSLQSLDYNGLAETIESSYDSMVSKKREYIGNTKIFIDGLKHVYREMLVDQPTVCFNSVKQNTTDVFVIGSLERMETTESEMEPEVWTRVDSHEEMFEPLYHRIIVEGEPGYGKTTTSVQLVHEWCREEHSEVDVLVFLRLRDVGKLSLYQAIRLFALPNDCRLTEAEIYQIMSSRSLRVVFILDGYDEYTNLTKESDFVKLIYMRILDKARVIITTRAHYMDDIAVKGVTRMRFAGFDEELQMRYVAKAFGSGQANFEKLTESFLEKTILVDMCQVPFFFAHFTQIMLKDPNIPNLRTVTGYMKYLVDSCFSSKLSGEDVPRVQEEDVIKFAKVAFESLKADHRHYIWDLKAFRKAIGHECCDRFTKAGILVQTKRRVKFFHSFFQEFLAALYMLHLTKSGNQFLLENSLDAFRPKERKHMFLFGCGLSKDVATTVINFFLPHETYILTMKFCLLDVRRNTPPLLDAVRRICDKYLSIYIFESRLVHRASVNVLRIATKNKILVQRIWMIETFGTADPITGDIVLKNGIELPRVTTVRQVVIGTERGRELKLGEWTGLLKYAAFSKKIENLNVYWCLLPFSTPPREIPTALKSKSFTVRWGTLLVLEHQLELYSGKWQGKLNKIDMTKAEYEQEVVKFRERFKQMKWKRPLDELSDGFARLLKKTNPYE